MLPSLIRFSRSGLIQVLDFVRQGRPADDERHLRAVSIAVERGLCRGVPCADHGDLLAYVGVRLLVVVPHLGQIRPRHVQGVRLIEEPDRRDHVPRGVFPAIRDNREVPQSACNAHHALVQPHIDPFLPRHAAVILDRVLPRRLVALNREGVSPDFNQLGRRKELHPRRVSDQRVHERPFFDHERLKSLTLRLEGAG